MKFPKLLGFALALLIQRHVSAAEPEQLDKILGPGGSETWVIEPKSYIVGEEPALSAAPAQSLQLLTKGSLPASSECYFAFRLKPVKGGGSNVRCQLACATRADKTVQSLNFALRTAEGQTNLAYTISLTGTPAVPAQSGTQHLLGVTERSLGWPEDLRRIVESQIASASKPEQMLYTARCSVEPGRFRVWLNGRYLAELPLAPDFDPAGQLKITLGPQAELVTVRQQPLPPTDGHFETLSIAGNLTGATLLGNKVDEASLPGAETNAAWPLHRATVAGVPFELPSRNATGNDHLDVGTSWARHGALPGYIASNFGSFGGRWISADRLDPSRHCLYVPGGRYKALHLLAMADERPDTVPLVTAQFYRPNAGHPINFSATVPAAGAAAQVDNSVAIRFGDGRQSRLYHITIPLDPDAFSWFTDLKTIGLEITKEVQYFRGYPDPLEYSWHGGGLPSSVQIYGVTLERAGVDVELVPAKFAHVWTAPEKPAYQMELRNRTGVAAKAKLKISGADPQEFDLDLPASDSPVRQPILLKPSRFGLHQLKVTVTAGGETSTYQRDFAYLHANTRDQQPWQDDRGAIFGYWPWNGGHVTPTADKEIEIMAAAGAETSTANYALSPPDIRALAEKHHFVGEAAFHGGIMYQTGLYGPPYQNSPKYDAAKEEEISQTLIASMKKNEAKPSAISRPTYVPFFAEPQIGNITTGIWPSHYGEEYQLSEVEQTALTSMKARFLLAGRAVRKEWPGYKLLMPYGDPMNTVVFLKQAPETRGLIDGIALDMPGFERLPEQQINQVVLHRLQPILQDVKQQMPSPYLVLIEGFHVSSKDIDTGEIGQADISMRNFLLLMGYGLTRFESSNAPFDCADYWGENHYGGGWCGRLPLAMPKLAYVHYATLTRHLNRANFTCYLPTGSTSTYCEQFKHYRTGQLIHVLWTVRGRRPVSIKVPAGTKLKLYDPQDNEAELADKNGNVTFEVNQSPQYLEGLTTDAEITLGESDHSDAQPAAGARLLANFGDGTWSLSDEADLDYTKNKPLQIERFPAKMSTRITEAPATQGNQALAVHLEAQEKDRGVMPFYTTLKPTQPIAIPGQASHLGLWVHASSDWGRIVYVLRDAKGEKWISVGTKEEWNNDDIHAWSAFCFDGWRYLRFQLPMSLPYDSYRGHGTSWWGSTGGDGAVDLPLRLEKVMVERRPKVIYGNDLVPAKADDVLLASLSAEYARSGDEGEEAVRLSRVRMPVPQNAPDLDNPIAGFVRNGVAAPTKVLGVSDPTSTFDGTRCHVNFVPVAGAKSYDVWVSPYADGRGALPLGKAWTGSGQLLQGLRPDLEFHLFVIYTDAEGKVSQPSTPFAFRLKDRFGYK